MTRKTLPAEKLTPAYLRAYAQEQIRRHGVPFEQATWQQIVEQQLTLPELAHIANADQRAVAVRMLRPDRLLQLVQAQLLDTGRKGTRLYKVKNFMGTGRTEYCILMQDASTERQFLEWVEPEVGKQGNAELCQAYAFGISLEDWLQIPEENEG